jgi:hypothetical protein
MRVVGCPPAVLSKDPLIGRTRHLSGESGEPSIYGGSWLRLCLSNVSYAGDSRNCVVCTSVSSRKHQHHRPDGPGHAYRHVRFRAARTRPARRAHQGRLAAAAEHGRKAGRREVTAAHAKVKRVHDLRAQGLAPADIGKIIGVSRATVYRYLSIGSDVS